jgi:hypothetical protein
MAQGSRYTAKCARRCRIDRQRIEIGFGLLDVRLTGGTILIGSRLQGSHRELRERHGRNDGLRGQRARIFKIGKHDDRAGVQHAALVT